MSVYTTITKSQEHGKKSVSYKKLIPSKSKDDLAELFSEEEDQKKHKSILSIENPKSKNHKL